MYSEKKKKTEGKKKSKRYISCIAANRFELLGT